MIWFYVTLALGVLLSVGGTAAPEHSLGQGVLFALAGTCGAACLLIYLYIVTSRP